MEQNDDKVPEVPEVKTLFDQLEPYALCYLASKLGPHYMANSLANVSKYLARTLVEHGVVSPSLPRMCVPDEFTGQPSAFQAFYYVAQENDETDEWVATKLETSSELKGYLEIGCDSGDAPIKTWALIRWDDFGERRGVRCPWWGMLMLFANAEALGWGNALAVSGSLMQNLESRADLLRAWFYTVHSKLAEGFDLQTAIYLAGYEIERLARHYPALSGFALRAK